MSLSYKEALKLAEKYNDTLLATDYRFNRALTVSNEDGSYFHYKNALVGLIFFTTVIYNKYATNHKLKN